MTYQGIFQKLKQTGFCYDASIRQVAVILNAGIAAYSSGRLELVSKKAPASNLIHIHRGRGFSSGTYEVIERTGEYVTYRNRLGNLHTVKADRTKEAA